MATDFYRQAPTAIKALIRACAELCEADATEQADAAANVIAKTQNLAK